MARPVGLLQHNAFIKLSYPACCDAFIAPRENWYREGAKHAKRACAELAAAIADFQPVTVLANPAEVRQLISKSHPLPNIASGACRKPW